ncbi:3-oxoadipate enol-lactonase [Thioclava sp. 'Guangxiensis']|uniref:3-oxoadipate enol-lactonase n=1 Tax=Thioclava sp. 'Guangxiensis' TaxID=3149044 RepID=UPI00387790D4
MHSFDRMGRKVHYRLDGPEDAPVLVLSNSLGTDLRVWDAFLAALPGQWRVLRLDKPGHGLSDAPAADLTIAELAEDIAALCDAYGLRDLNFVGLSIGGMIGQELAATRPDLMRALVLMDTAAKIGTPEMWTTRINAIRENGIVSLEAAILERWFVPAFRKTDQFALWRNMLIRTDDFGYTACCAAIAAADLTESTRALTLPVMAMAGDQDGSTPPDLVRATAALCNAEFHLIDNAGHLPCVEHPKHTAELIAAFFNRI